MYEYYKKQCYFRLLVDIQCPKHAMKKNNSDYPPFWGLFASSIALFNALRNVVPLAVKCSGYQQLNFEIHERQEALLPSQKN
jgi:hypothetical protein